MLVKHDPSRVAVKKPSFAVVRVKVRVGKLVVLTVLGSPAQCRFLERRGAEKKEQKPD